MAQLNDTGTRVVARVMLRLPVMNPGMEVNAAVGCVRRKVWNNISKFEW